VAIPSVDDFVRATERILDSQLMTKWFTSRIVLLNIRLVYYSTELQPERINHQTSKCIVASVRMRASGKIGHVGIYESKVFFVVLG
jgi:hypothetical protein